MLPTRLPNSCPLCWALLLMVLAPTTIWAQEIASPSSARDTTDLPPAPEVYMGRRIARTMHFLGAEWLIREAREKEEACSKLLGALDVQLGQTVCDLGCGNGFYTLKLAKLVGPNGTVWAVDIQPEMLDLLAERAAARNVTNLQPTLGGATSPNLPPEAIDLVLLVDVYHEFSHPKQMLEQVRASLRPNGRVALVEYRAEDPDVPIKPLHKMSQQQVMKEYEANGFKLVGQYDDLPWQHVFFFARDDSPLDAIQLTPWSESGE
jgi:ubiquinone/menaquinone biosynthesis C-methylase UbiE